MIMMKTFFEQMGGAYKQAGDVFIPAFTVEKSAPIGKYGRMRRQYLKEQHPILFSILILSGELYGHLTEIDHACNDRMELIARQMAKQEGVTEVLKAADQLEWVRRMNGIQSRAEEIVLSELVYC